MLDPARRKSFFQNLCPYLEPSLIIYMGQLSLMTNDDKVFFCQLNKLAVVPKTGMNYFKMEDTIFVTSPTFPFNSFFLQFEVFKT